VAIPWKKKNTGGKPIIQEIRNTDEEKERERTKYTAIAKKGARREKGGWGNDTKERSAIAQRKREYQKPAKKNINESGEAERPYRMQDVQRFEARYFMVKGEKKKTDQGHDGKNR